MANKYPPAPPEEGSQAGDPANYPKHKIESYYLFGGLNPKASAYINGPHEFRDILNLNFLYPGALTKRPGSTMYAGSTVIGSILGGVEFQKQSGASFILMAANTNLYTVTPPASVNAVVTGLFSNVVMNFTTFVDRVFCSNGHDFFKFDGTNNYLFSLPPGVTNSFGASPVNGGSLTVGVTTTFLVAYGYVNERGYAGPLSNGVTIVINGTSQNSISYWGMTQAFSGYGITAIQLWRTSAGGVDFFGSTQVPSNTVTVTDTGFLLGSSLSIPHLWFTLIPKYSALYNNQLFLAGFSQFPSRVYWSEIGEPEAIQPTYYNDFRTNDGDRITGMKVYSGALILSKFKSCHRLIGDNPADFVAQEITNDYGCVSHNAMVVYENILWMLDQKGIVEFDGANISIISDKPDPFFLAMNVPFAVDTAFGIHYKYYNEVWFSFPSDASGATINNVTIVYDYFSKAWTRYDNMNHTCLFQAQGTQVQKTVFYGGLTGALFYMGSSFYGDNGNAFTCMAFTRWLTPLGKTTENMYRRFWLDTDPVLGVTQSIAVNFFSNFATNVIAATGMINQSTFQSRIDFGISARSIAAQIFYSNATLPLKINAYTFESRYQRST